HKPGSPAAILVTSRRPGPARARAPGGASAHCAAIALATRCGTCETSATHRSCSAGDIRTGCAPQALARSVTAAIQASDDSLPGQITHGWPAKRSALAAAGPDRSLPDIGCPGTNEARSHPVALASRNGSSLTLATSV